MLDFLNIKVETAGRSNKDRYTKVYPAFKTKKSTDLMIRGRDFYAVWDEPNGLWSTDEDTVIDLIDSELDAYVESNKEKLEEPIHISHMWDSNSGAIDNWHKFVQKQARDYYKQLDSKLIFANSDVKKEYYATKKLSYNLEETDTPAYDLLMSTIFAPDERQKLEWAIGAIVKGEASKIQKFIVLYGGPGTGKSTFLNFIVQQLFDGYYSSFEASALTDKNNQFALEAFKSNPLVAVQHDGDLSRIFDNTKLNSIVSHEKMVINEKFKSQYEMKFQSFLFMGTNTPVYITGSKSGMNRRLIDVRPTGNKLSSTQYDKCTSKIKFELSGIAYRCLKVYEDLGKDFYNNYDPKDMREETDPFYDFILEYCFQEFKEHDGTTLTYAWDKYKKYCEYAGVKYPYSHTKVKAELKDYFLNFQDRCVLDNGERVRSYYSGFVMNKFGNIPADDIEDGTMAWLTMNYNASIFDKVAIDYPAQYASEKETPIKKWDEVSTKIRDLNTVKLHYVKVPENHIVIDFDIKDESGNKSFELNKEAAGLWPPTYAELSKGGQGIHLHYIYKGDVSELSRVYSDEIEIKVFTGNSSLRRKLTKCNNSPIVTINGGLPLKGAKKMVNFEALKNEKALRTLIKKNLNKEYHDSTKPSIDFIYKVLEDAYSSELHYDVSDMRQSVLIFANNSSHQSEYCVNLVGKMHFKSEEPSESAIFSKDSLVFYDVEVFPNLFLINWKVEGEDQKVVRMINPTPSEVEELVKFKLIGFNCRRYDNHILYARINGYTNMQLYKLSQRIISGDRNAMFGEAYNISYTDVYDFSSKKQSLKKFEIELGIHHHELGLKWDEPVDEELWETVAEYCDDDVLATEAVFNARHEDFVARQILTTAAHKFVRGCTVNTPTNTLTTKIIFRGEKHPHDYLEYTDLSSIFPGYKYDSGKSIYRDEEVGEGGYVYSEPGMYSNVALLDIASMHPHSIKELNMFGKYTNNFVELMDARMAVKHHDYITARKMLDGALADYIPEDMTDEKAKLLANALKIAINSVYGLTSAKFDNPFRDIRNVDNIVAKRGALFMIDLKHAVQERGFTVAHIKTDSIKIPDATPKIIEFVKDFGKKFGYSFEHEATYDRMCLVNNAVYIAKYQDSNDRKGEWTATGTQFQIPYVFKTLFSKDKIEFEDLCETKSVTTALYLDLNENLPEGEHDYKFIGKVGRFCPILEGHGGGLLMRGKDGKYNAATGSKGYRWLESEEVKELGKEDDIDQGYYISLVDDAVSDISKYGDFERFIADEPYLSEFEVIEKEQPFSK